MIALGIVIATAAAFVASTLYYGIGPSLQTAPSPQRAVGAQVIVELLRNLAVASLVAGLLAAGEWSGVAAGVVVGVALWILPVVLFVGAVFHEGLPVREAALHAGDWLIKLITIGAIDGLFS